MIESLERQAIPATDSPKVPFTDERLMELIQDHIRNGLDLLHERYGTLLKTLGMRVLHNDADAEDLLQDVFVEIWERAATYNPQKGRPLSWLATLTRRRAIDRLRKRETYHRVEDRFAAEIKCGGGGWTHVHEELARAEADELLHSALATLPEAQCNAIKYAYYHQMSQREIAQHTGIPLGTIKTRLELGMKKMAAFLCGFEDLLGANNSRAEIKPHALRPR